MLPIACMSPFSWLAQAQMFTFRGEGRAALSSDFDSGLKRFRKTLKEIVLFVNTFTRRLRIRFHRWLKMWFDWKIFVMILCSHYVSINTYIKHPGDCSLFYFLSPKQTWTILKHKHAILSGFYFSYWFKFLLKSKWIDQITGSKSLYRNLVRRED